VHLLKTLFSLLFILQINFSFAEVHSAQDYYNHLELVLRSYDFDEFEENLRVVSKNPTSDLRVVLVEKLNDILSFSRSEIEENLNLAEFGKIIYLTIEKLGVIGSKDESSLLGELADWLNDNLRNNQLSEQVLNTILALNEVPQNDLLSVEALIQDQSRALTVTDQAQHRGNFEFALQRVDDLLAEMQKTVVEQDEILKDLQSLFIRDTLVQGQRLKPEILYLMGLPGTGKDTIAEAYVDALWNQKGAHELHLFNMDIRSKSEMWSYLGSGKGYANAGELTALLRFLVEHSGGKYKLTILKNQRGDEKTIIEKGPNFYGEFTGKKPHRAVIFVNEAHNIPKEVKDDLLKQAIERGRFPITNPGQTADSVSEIRLPVTFIFGSNEGISLLEPREKNGARIGEPLSYEELLENYNKVKDNKDALKQAILDHNGEKNNPVQAEDPGTSEEFLSRIPSGRIHLMKPISLDGLRRITRILEEAVTLQLREANGDLGSFDIRLSEDFVQFLIGYNYIPSEGARHLKDRLDTFFRKPFEETLRNRRIRPNSEHITIDVDLRTYDNNARSLTFNVFEAKRDEIDDEQEPNYSFTRLIERTLSDIEKRPISDEEIQHILSLREQITSNVFGVEHIVDRLIDSILTSESESRNTEVQRAATVLAFLGKTSTGKTETAKQYVSARYGEDEQPAVIDFNGIRDLESMKAKVLGTVDSRNNPIASEFMKKYDRANGRIAFIFDEAANAPKELLKALYEILREPTATGFSDGKARPMKNVTIILTGNAGEEIYNNIPTHLSDRSYEQAMNAVFNVFIRNETLQNKVLTQTFPEALLARIGRNIFHFGPLTNKTKRQLAQLKLLQGLERLKPSRSERGWNLLFASNDDLLNIFNMIEMEGYNQDYQGASIDKFVKEGLIDSIKASLLAAGAPNESDVILSLGDLVEPKEVNEPPYRIITLTLANAREVEVKVELRRVSKDLPKAEIFRLLTNFHEVGHEIVSHYYFHEFIEPMVLKKIPGVAIINEELVVYNGIRSGKFTQASVTNKEEALREIAIMVGGYTAEQIVTSGDYHTSGKSNDNKRATLMVQQAVLQWGLSNRWGTRAIPANMILSDYLLSLPEADKELLSQITQDWIKQAEDMASTAILSNLEGAFYNLSVALAREGVLQGEQIKEIYAETGFVYDYTQTSHQGFNPMASYAELRAILEPNKDKLLERFSLDATNTEDFYEKAFNEMSRLSVGFLARTTRRYKTWTDLNEHEKLLVQVIISSMFEVKNIFPQLSSDRYALDEVVDADQMLEQMAGEEKEGILEPERFDLYTPALTETEPTSQEAPISTRSLSCKALLSL